MNGKKEKEYRMNNKIFSAFQLTVEMISILVYYIIKIMSINFLQPLPWL